jgi:hypothetical protein
MKNIFNWIKNNPNRAMFLVPIILTMVVSIIHVITWYKLSNPISWSIFMSIAIEVGAITALIAATNKIKGIWFMFGIVTFIQMIGNIFYSYKGIDINGDLFKSWVELTGPIWELMGTELTDVVGVKRWLAFLEGGLLPIISLTSLHFFVKYEKPKTEEKSISVKNTEVKTEKIWDEVKQLKKDGKLNEPTDQEIIDEPIALANSGDIVKENKQTNLLKEQKPKDEILKKDFKNVSKEINKTWKNFFKQTHKNNNITKLGA